MPTYDKNDKGQSVVSLADANRGRKYQAAKSNDDFKKELAQRAREDAESKIEQYAPARIVETRCHICQHPYRDWIEMMLVRGMSIKGISERVSPAPGFNKVSRDSISNHYKKHMDLQDAALRYVIEQEAQLQGINQEEGMNDAVTKRAVLEIALRKGYEDIVNGVTTVEPRDLVQITKVLADMDTNQYQTGLDELRAQVQIFMQAIKNVCDEDIRDSIAKEVKRLRQREGVAGTIERAMDPPAFEPPEVVDAEVVPDDKQISNT